MKSQLRILILTSILAGISLGHVQANATKAEILNDREMAAVRGGFCLFETCETGQPTGNCQPVPDTYAGVCPQGTCRFIAVTIPFVGEEDICSLFGKYTCTEAETYRKCITGKLWDICPYSSVNVCGNLVLPACEESIEEHTCSCVANFMEEPCDWTNCLLESQ